jgi:hypothetical protein
VSAPEEVGLDLLTLAAELPPPPRPIGLSALTRHAQGVRREAAARARGRARASRLARRRARRAERRASRWSRRLALLVLLATLASPALALLSR